MRGAEYAELVAFIAVAQEKSFAQASVRLGSSRSALSHTIRSLEDRLGARLLNRTTRSVGLTEAGLMLFSRISPAFAEIRDAVARVRQFSDCPSGDVRITLPRLAAELVLAPVIGRFRREYPEVRLELSVNDALTDIVASGFDAGIRPGEMVQRDMLAVRVTPDLRFAIVGSPDYFQERPAPSVPGDLVKHDCINYRFTESGGVHRWPLAKEGKHFDVAVNGALILNDSNLVMLAAIEGAGLACTLESQVASHLATGNLIRVLEDWCPQFPGFFLYYPSQSHMAPALRVLIDFLRI